MFSRRWRRGSRLGFSTCAAAGAPGSTCEKAGRAMRGCRVRLGPCGPAGGSTSVIPGGSCTALLLKSRAGSRGPDPPRPLPLSTSPLPLLPGRPGPRCRRGLAACGQPVTLDRGRQPSSLAVEAGLCPAPLRGCLGPPSGWPDPQVFPPPAHPTLHSPPPSSQVLPTYF